MRTLKTSEAAAVLNVSPNTLRTWERRFGYPKPQRSPGRHRLYSYAEIAALRDALEEGLSISSAISVATQAFGVDGHALVTALLAFRADRADRAMEESLALRSLERTLEEVLLPSLADVRRRKGLCSAAWAYAARWSVEWLQRAQRLAGSAPRGPGLLVGDATGGLLDPATPYLHVVDLCCAAAGVNVLVLPVRAVQWLSEPLAIAQPAAVVIAGSEASDDDVARWAYTVRRAAGEVPFVLYQRGVDGAVGGAKPRVLPLAPREAVQAILDLLDRARVRTDGAPAPRTSPGAGPLVPGAPPPPAHAATAVTAPGGVARAL